MPEKDGVVCDEGIHEKHAGIDNRRVYGVLAAEGGALVVHAKAKGETLELAVRKGVFIPYAGQSCRNLGQVVPVGVLRQVRGDRGAVDCAGNECAAPTDIDVGGDVLNDQMGSASC